jgi:AcrR family transcriptional regulator
MASLAQPLKTQIQDGDLVRARRRQIFQAACRVLARKSFHEATVKEIAVEAGIAAGSIYVYLQSKDDILFLLAESMVAELSAILPAIHQRNTDDPCHELLDVMRALIDLIDRYREAFRVLHHEVRYLIRRPQYRQALGRILDRYVAAVSDVLERGRAMNVIYFEDSRSVVHLILSLCSGWAMGAGYLKDTGKGTYLREIESILRGRFFHAAPLEHASRRQGRQQRGRLRMMALE